MWLTQSGQWFPAAQYGVTEGPKVLDQQVGHVVGVDLIATQQERLHPAVGVVGMILQESLQRGCCVPPLAVQLPAAGVRQPQGPAGTLEYERRAGEAPEG